MSIETNKENLIRNFGAKTPLYDLPDSEFTSGTDLSQILKAAGYDETPRTVINNWNSWNQPLGKFLATFGDGPLPHWADMSLEARQAAWEAGQSRASDADGVQSMTTGFYGKGEV